MFDVKCLQGDCPPCLKNYFKIQHNPYGTRQRWQLEYPRARIRCGYSRVQYRAVVDLWNKLGSNLKTILDRNKLNRSLCEKFVSHWYDWICKYVSYICVYLYHLHFIIYLREMAGMMLRKYLYANVSYCKFIHIRLLVLVGLSLK